MAERQSWNVKLLARRERLKSTPHSRLSKIAPFSKYAQSFLSKTLHIEEKHPKEEFRANETIFFSCQHAKTQIGEKILFFEKQFFKTITEK